MSRVHFTAPWKSGWETWQWKVSKCQDSACETCDSWAVKCVMCDVMRCDLWGALKRSGRWGGAEREGFSRVWLSCLMLLRKYHDHDHHLAADENLITDNCNTTITTHCCSATVQSNRFTGLQKPRRQANWWWKGWAGKLSAFTHLPSQCQWVGPFVSDSHDHLHLRPPSTPRLPVFCGGVGLLCVLCSGRIFIILHKQIEVKGWRCCWIRTLVKQTREAK